MSSDFYLKAQTLYEEFRKKEIHYLNAERKLNDSLMWKKDLNMPLQEYLQNIHLRERKNEETYQNIMKQMNELDQHTDLLCSKIEKLGIFKTIQVGQSLNDTNYQFTSRYIPQTFNSLQNFNREPIVSNFEFNSLKSPLKTASTQTDSNVYCDNCRTVIGVSYQMSQMQNSTSSAIDILSVSRNELEIINSSQLQNDSLSNKNDSNFQLIASPLNTETLPSKIYENRRHVEKISENELQTSERHNVKSLEANTSSEKRQFSLQSNEVLDDENVIKNSKSKQELTASQSKLSDSEINVENSVSKRDSDSVNHEFDFLESDAIHLSPKIKPQDNSKSNTVPLSNVHENFDQATSLDIKLSNKSSVKTINERDLFGLNKEQEISDNRSEFSESVSGTHSPAISLSDTDSINEKGSFTASAAYQSLLGNTALPPKINKQISESESEDEVEKTLARSVQKSNIKTKTSVQSKKDKNIPQSVDSKPTINKPKLVSMNKPQSKLSKSTKKVLGLDTSSSSEIEAVVKSSQNKKDEDSDEFDFYD